MEKSPYLLQHADNPVDWYPWGKEAFEKAKKRDMPIFLSIGYATCHWCHVMAHECFEDETVAGIMNRHFVSIKVDREERPDVDKIYMDICQALTGRGGWPLSAFLTPDGAAFFAGTYFPKTRRMGMPGFVDILDHMASLWANDRQRLEQAGKAVLEAIHAPQESLSKCPRGTVNTDLLKKGAAQLTKVFDLSSGGFGTAPKFPTSHHLTFLLRWFKRSHDPGTLQMVEKTLTAMRHGGIFDQVGFGFHRYSVDDRWFVPHFEKMLYDQALLSIAYMEAFQVTGNPLFSQVAQEIFTYVLRDMKTPQGGFCAAQDADSEGQEGLFYLWTHEEVNRHLGKPAADLFCRFYGITEKGNFENEKSIPYVRMSMEAFSRRENMALPDVEKVLNESRDHLFLERKKRIHPLKDDKILTSWNGLMIAALAKGAQVFSRPAYRQAADEAAWFVLKHLRNKEGRLLRRYREGEAAYPAYLDDYAFLVWGLIELYEASFDVSHLENAIVLTHEMIDLFWDPLDGGLFFTGIGNETLVARSKDVYDGALPSGNSVALLNFLRLSRMTGNMEFDRRAGELAERFVQKIEDHPMAYTHFLSGCDFMVGPSKEIVISGDPGDASTQAMIDRALKPFLPNAVLLVRSPGAAGKRLAKIAPFVESMDSVEGRPAAYVCEGGACQVPTSDIQQFASLLK